jgi:aspartyl-tRNA(Asn)/glutamyl-tRNA(Gln) amidotransferase subunit C
MPALTRKEVEEIALLARLSLESDELERMQAELAAILEHFQAISEVDTTDVPAMTHAVPMDLRMRLDLAQPSLPAEVALAAAPRRDGDLIVVPSSIAQPGQPGRSGTGTGTEP